jgi:hypothetical protein
MIDGTKLGQVLVREGLLNEAQLKHALDFQRNTGGDLRDILPKLGYVREPVLLQYIAREEHMHWVDPEQSDVDEELMAKIPRDVIERHQIVPLRGENGVVLAVSDAEDFAAIDEVQFLTNRPVESALASRASIRKTINQFYQRADTRRKGDERPKPASELVRRVSSMSSETLVRALVLSLIERGELEADRFFAHAAEVEGLTRGR